MKILLCYAPFCTPAVPPYSIANLSSFLKSNLPEGYLVEVLDLNVRFHALKFKAYQKYYKNLLKFDPAEYDKMTSEYRRESSEVYSESNKGVVEGKSPEFLKEFLDLIIEASPDFVAFSIVYSSQAFYAYMLIEQLKKQSISTVVGGPAVNDKLRAAADFCLSNELELLEMCLGKKVAHEEIICDYGIDFSVFPLQDYFVPSSVLPLKTSSSCYYQQCTFCTHHGKGMYYEYPLGPLSKTIKENSAKRFFIVDDMIPKKRLLEIAKIMKEAKADWTCQLKPTKEFDSATLKILCDSGLKMVIWGVESGCDRILKLMKKGTNKADIAEVLQKAKAAGIKNAVYIMFGFPTETKEEFIETIEFLKSNTENIDLVSTSIFGLQKGSPVYAEPKKFGITKIIETKRTILEPSINYEVESGMTQEEASRMRGKYKRTLEKLNKYPKMMNIFREHMLCVE